jgi:hypothetical protein
VPTCELRSLFIRRKSLGIPPEEFKLDAEIVVGDREYGKSVFITFRISAFILINLT